MSSPDEQKRLQRLSHKRFMPLYIAAFFQGFILWYTLEKLFMTTIGFDEAGIGAMVAIYSAVMLLVETPSGILADRWSRKGVLVMGSLFLAASSLICGISNDPATYIFGAVLWGMFYAMYSGTYESIIYDSLLEDANSGDEYEKYYGRIAAIDSVALVVSSILGGVIGQLLGLRPAYYITVPLVLISILALLRFKEPTLHKAATDAKLVRHVKNTFGAILKNKHLLPVLAVLLLNGIITAILYEVNQLWLIALAVPVISFGIANSLMLATLGVGGLVASWLKLYQYRILIVALGIMIISCLGLIFARNLPAILAAQVLLGVGLTAVEIVFTRFLHDELPSKIRAGAASAVSSITRVLVIPVVLLFGYVSRELTVYNAAWIFFVIMLLLSYFVFKTFAANRHLVAVEPEDSARIETYKK